MSKLLSPEVLRRLYVEEGRTDSEIAKEVGTYQVRVSRLRKQWGIPTRSKSDRLRLPELSRAQKSLLLGSLLGDGRLMSTGSETAGYSEYHSLSQLEYLEWKRDLWGPFVKSVRPVIKRENGKAYEGKILRLHGARCFRSYWEQMYREGRGFKTFDLLDLSDFDAFSLAVWFMDDGGKTSNGYVSLSVTPRAEDHAVLLRLLEGFGLAPTLYQSNKGDHSIWVHTRSGMSTFLDLVSPHVPKCMMHKVDLAVRKRGTAPRDRLTPDFLEQHKDRGVEWLASALEVSSASVKRAADRHNVLLPKQPVVDPRKVWGEAKACVAGGVSGEALVDLLVSLPLPPGPSEEESSRDWLNLCRNQTVKVSDGIVEGGGSVGLTLCQRCFPYRYEAYRQGKPSLSRAWFDREWVRKAVRYQIKHGDPLFPMNVFRALRAQLQTPSNFRPTVAKKLVEMFGKKGSVVLDPCAGYGGRAAGVLAAGCGYVGVDPHPKAPAAYRRLASLVGRSLEFHNLPIEEVDLGDLKASLVLTSPPYFSVERYSEDTGQSWVRYTTWDMWLDRFLSPLLERASNHLEVEGYFLLNVTNVASERLPLVNAALALAEKKGLSYEGQLSMRLAYFGRGLREEPILVLRKASGKSSVSKVWKILEPKRYPRKTPRSELTCELLTKLYSEDLLTDAAIGKLYEVSDVTVSQHRKLFGIPTITSQRRLELKGKPSGFSSLTKEALEALYQTMGDSLIAKKYGVSKTAVRMKRKRFGIASSGRVSKKG